ncbi:DUF2391 family protein [Candidatus Woesearchaeota archaeon]|nr:DUF2391 family protein [Candidatus Woesearchaeota archaeon]
MVKKRVKKSRVISKNKPKAASKEKPEAKRAEKIKIEQPADTKITLQDALHNLEILSEEKKVEHRIEGVEKKEAAIEKKEADIEKKEAAIMSEERKIEKEAEKVEKIEKEIKREVTPKPLKAIKFVDINKGIIGAFIGVVAHYAFIYGREIAKDISTARATILIIFSYFLIIILMYETGYRQIKEKRLFYVLPRRATIIYLTSIAVIILIFFLFNQLNLSNIDLLYKEIAVTLVLASVGAGTADLIGKD